VPFVVRLFLFFGKNVFVRKVSRECTLDTTSVRAVACWRDAVRAGPRRASSYASGSAWGDSVVENESWL
jgi:hypothetical protein